MPKAAWKILRSQSYSEKEFRPYVTLIGQTALAWNDLHEHMGLIFWTFIDTPPAISAWQANTVDRSKRKMLEAVVSDLEKGWHERFPQLRADLKWLLDEAEKREDDRNTVVHAPLHSRGLANLFIFMAGRPPMVAPHVRLGHKRAARLEGKEILDEYRWARDSILTLRNFADAIHEALIFPRRAWPQRPALPNRGQKKTRQRHQVPRE